MHNDPRVFFQRPTSLFDFLNCKQMGKNILRCVKISAPCSVLIKPRVLWRSEISHGAETGRYRKFLRKRLVTDQTMAALSLKTRKAASRPVFALQ